MTTFIPAAKAQTGNAPRILTTLVFMLGLALGAGLVGLSFSFPVDVGAFPWLLLSGLVVVVSCLMGLGLCVLSEVARKRRELEALPVSSLVALLEAGWPGSDPRVMAYDALSTLNRCHPGWSARHPR